MKCELVGVSCIFVSFFLQTEFENLSKLDNSYRITAFTTCLLVSCFLFQMASSGRPLLTYSFDWYFSVE